MKALLVSFKAAVHAIAHVAVGATLLAASLPATAQSVYAPNPDRHDKPLLEFKDAPPGYYELDPPHAHLLFKMSHYGGLSNPYLRFTVVDADYTWDPKKPEAPRIVAKIKTSSFESLDRSFEVRMMGPNGFQSYEEGKYEYITFESTEIKFTGKNPEGKHVGTMKGDLTIKGVTKPVVLDLTYGGFYTTPSGWQKMGWSATSTLDRFEWGFNTVPSVSKNVNVIMELEFFRFASKGGERVNAKSVTGAH